MPMVERDLSWSGNEHIQATRARNFLGDTRSETMSCILGSSGDFIIMKRGLDCRKLGIFGRDAS